ncbi:non-ribosomal peptide synthetase, partial [Streptomyces clavuligerus]
MRRPEQGCSPEEVEDEVLDAERWEAFGERSEEHGIVPVTAVAAACALVAGAWDGDPTRRSVADRAHLLPAGERSGGALLTGGPTRVRVSFAVLGTDPALTLRWSAEESTGTEESAGTEEGSAAKEAEEDTEAGEGGEAARAGRALPGHTAGLHAATRRLLSLLATDDAAWSRTDLGWIPGFDPILPNEPPARCGPLDGPVRQAMAARPEAPALHTADRTVRFGELASLVDALRARLDERGTGPGDVVAVALDKSPEQIAAVLAVVGAGAAYVPIGADWPAERVSQVIEQSGAQTLLTTTDLVEQGRVRPSVGLLTVDTTPPAPPAGQGGPAEDTAGPDDLAYVIYTSGSTGTPKGVAVEHTAARNTVDDITERFGVGPDDSVLGLSALSFDLSVYDIFGVLGAGGRIVLPDPSAQHDPAHWRELAATHRVTVWNTAPALLEMLVDHSEGDPEQARADLSSLRLVLLSGDWIPVTLPDRLRALAPGARVISLGGATEASIWSIHHPIGEVDPAWRSVPYGVPLRDQWFHILDEELRPVAVGAVGELFIGGAGLAREYLGDPERTAERFLVHPVTGHRLYRTGDLGRWHPDGTIEFLGRNDRQVKLRGHRIELAEIEARLACHPRVRQSAVKVLRAGQGDRLIAYAVLHGPLSDAEQVLHEHLAALLPAYMLPSRIVRLGRLPTTANGKIDYAALPDPHTDPEAPDTPADAHRVPTTPAEKALAGIWSEILGIDDIGLDEDFFGLGGDSLLAARMAGAVKARLGVALPVSGVYDGCTLEQFARMMTDRDDHRPAAPEALAADPDERSFPLTDLQQAYWIGQQDLYRLSYHSAHFSLDFEAEGLDPAALQRAVDRIVAHQPMLRARLLDDGRQEILNPEQVPAYPLRVRDLRGLGAAEQDATVEHTREELARSGPRPESWPLFDLRVDLLTERVSRLYLCCSLLIADGWSFNLFFEELFAVHGDPDARLERLRVTFRDYVLARERLRAGDDYRRHREYWLRRLDTLPPAPRLPLV